MAKVRLDVLMVKRGLAESRSQAQRLIMAGRVRAAGQLITRPAADVRADIPLKVEQGPLYVSRGGEKLASILSHFPVRVEDQVCADVGASTGGFTDCLLQHGAHRVYAIDVGYGILHWKLRQDPRVVVMERTNARYVERLAEPVQLVTVDASFISLRILLPVVSGWFSPQGGQVVALIKPQFEAGRREAARGDGVIRNPQIHARVLQETLEFAQQIGYSVNGLLRSPLLGPKGNVEFLAWLLYPSTSPLDLAILIKDILTSVENGE
jgi:23S rRNA (cytidine1920-2'-O)/16S rRNA (cytidine1409-2'-O)-methyltransferase